MALSVTSGGFPLESYDGETLYFTDRPSKSSLHMASLQKPGTESVLRGMPEVLDPSEWTVVPRGIYFVPADAPKSVRFFDFAIKQVRQIFPSGQGFRR